MAASSSPLTTDASNEDRARGKRFRECLQRALRVDLRGCGKEAVKVILSRHGDLESMVCRRYRAESPVGPSDVTTEGEITNMYNTFFDGKVDQRTMDGIMLVLKLAVSLANSGMSTAEIETLVCGVAKSLSLPHKKISVTTREVQASFCGGSMHVLRCKHGKLLSKMCDLHYLALAVELADDPDLLTALAATDAINARDSPYGWALEWLAYHLFGAFASVAIFGGTGIDIVGVLMISIPVRAALMLCSAWRAFRSLQDLLVPAVVGVLTPIVTQVLQLPSCHNATIFLSLLLIDLPGSQLLFGALELKKGSMVGATRLVAAVVQTMFMAMSLTLGWQLTTTTRSIVTTTPCTSSTPWWMTNVVAMVPLEICFFIILSIRVRDIWAPGIAVMLTMLLSSVWQTHFPGMSSYVTNSVVMFVGVNMGCAVEYFTGMSSLQVILPIIIILAPGAGALRAVLANIDASLPGASIAAGDAWFDLLMQGVSFTVGQTFASELWGPILLMQAARRVKDTALQLSTCHTAHHMCCYYERRSATM